MFSSLQQAWSTLSQPELESILWKTSCHKPSLWCTAACPHRMPTAYNVLCTLWLPAAALHPKSKSHPTAYCQPRERPTLNCGLRSTLFPLHQSNTENYKSALSRRGVTCNPEYTPLYTLTLSSSQSTLFFHLSSYILLQLIISTLQVTSSTIPSLGSLSIMGSIIALL